MTKSIEVLTTNDYPIVRIGLRAVVEPASDIVVVGEAANGDEAVEKVCASLNDDSCNHIDLILMDLRFSRAPSTVTRAGGVDATAAIHTLAGCGAKVPEVLVVTNYSSDSDVFGIATTGAVGYLLKDATPEGLINSARRVVRGETVLNTQVTGRLMGQMRNPNTAPTPRELKIFELVARDISNRKITEQLVPAETTVKPHLVHTFIKLDVNSCTATVAWAQELGMLGE